MRCQNIPLNSETRSSPSRNVYSVIKQDNFSQGFFFLSKNVSKLYHIENLKKSEQL